MKCIEVQQMVKPYIDKRLSDRELEQFLNHIESCQDCYDELEIYFSIYETLGVSDSNLTGQDYDFKDRLDQDLKNARRYLKRRKIYHVFQSCMLFLTVLLLLFTIWIGFEMRGERSFQDTTIYRILHGAPQEAESEFETETGTGTEIETMTASEDAQEEAAGIGRDADKLTEKEHAEHEEREDRTD